MLHAIGAPNHPHGRLPADFLSRVRQSSGQSAAIVLFLTAPQDASLHGVSNLFNSILAGIAVFIGGFAFGHWVTNSDPAFIRILAKSERYKLRYDAAKQQVPRVEVV
jgi:type IV secretory pathway TrbD component